MSTREDHIQDWLQEVQEIEPGDQEELGKRWLANRTLIDLICEYFYELGDQPNNCIFDSLCVELLRLYQTRSEPLVSFVRQTIPVQIDAYLRLVAAGRRQDCATLELLLLGIYNCEIFTETGVPKVQRIRIPNLSVPSMYHDPGNLSQLGLMEPSAMANGRRRAELAAVAIGPFPPVEALSAQGRPLVMTALLKLYNVTASAATRESLLFACKVISRLCRSGLSTPEPELISKVFGSGSVESKEWSRYHRPPDDWRNQLRIPLHSSMLLEAVSLCYFSMFNDVALPGMQAMEDIQLRAGYELWPEVLLAAGSVIDSLLANPSGQPSEGPMGIKVDVAQHRRDTVKTGLVTNASFKGSKLPDDIPVPRLPSDLASDHTLATLSEESVESPLAAPRKSSSTKGVLSALHLPTPGKMKTSHSDMQIKGSSFLHKGASIGEQLEPPSHNSVMTNGHQRDSKGANVSSSDHGGQKDVKSRNGGVENGIGETSEQGGSDSEEGKTETVRVRMSKLMHKGSKKKHHESAPESRDGTIELTDIGPRV